MDKSYKLLFRLQQAVWRSKLGRFSYSDGLANKLSYDLVCWVTRWRHLYIKEYVRCRLDEMRRVQ